MNNNLDRLYELLPTIYRQRDAEEGFVLQALLRVVAEQVGVVEADIAQLYENWFIETCQDWVVPYIGDLIGYQVVHEAGEPSDVSTAEGRQRNKILIERRDVANTVLHRRRKGTLSLLEQLANDVADWPARAVEFYTLLGWTQNINDLQLERARTVDLRAGRALNRLDGPFDEIAHTVDVRRIISQRTRGRYNIPSVGVFVWRLRVYSVTMTRARLLEQVSEESFTFSVLGNDCQLYTQKQEKSETQRSSNELNFPTPILRRRFEEHPADYYGEDKSMFIWAGVYAQAQVEQLAKKRGNAQPLAKVEKQAPQVTWEAVPLERIVAADLSDWQYRPVGDQVAVDPVLGRIAFTPNHAPKGGVRVLYHYAFGADIGGGEYNRPLFAPPGEYQLFRVSKQEEDINSLEDALELWLAWKQANPNKPHRAVIEIADSGVYVENRLTTSLDAQEILHIRATNRKRPIIRLLEERVDRTNALDVEGSSHITGAADSRLVLDGLLIFGRGVHIKGELAEVTIRHCTLVPGWDLEHDCEPKLASEPGLTLTDTDAAVTIEHSILGAIRVEEKEVQEEPIRIQISDSILDATGNDCPALSSSAQHGHKAYARLTLTRCTVFGKVEVHAIDLAENSIFNSSVRVARSQMGCVRFCYVPDGSRIPSRYNCQPDLVRQAVENDDDILDAEKPAEKERESARVVPVFNSARYGTPTYCQLADACAEEIKRGADDESEMGAFHDLFQPQREANLRARLDEYTPAAMEAGIIYAS
jgi:hypothetical protein